MNDEIKEMMEQMESISITGKNKNGIKVDGYGLQQNGLKILLDYITNLQQENKEWEMIFDTFSKRPYAHRYLEEKRKELDNKRIIGLDSEMIYKEYYNYKSRCEKAIEYIHKNYYEIVYKTKGTMENDLLNILQNGSEEK